MRIRLAVLLVLLSATAACYHWTPAKATPNAAVRSGHRTLRVRLANGRRHTLTRVVLVGDSLRGFEAQYSRDTGRWTDVIISMALSDIQNLEVRRVDPVATGAVVALGVMTVGTVAAAIALSNADFGMGNWGGGGDTYVGEGCPMVYSHDGSRWRLDSGTFGGAIARAVARTDVDVLEYARAQDDHLRLRLTDELNETDYTDAIEVVAVDHAPDVTLVPDADGALHSVGPLTSPVAARDFRGRDALARVVSRDDWSWESIPTGRDTSRVEDVRDGLVLVFPRPRDATRGKLVVDGRNTQWATLMLGEFVGWHGNETGAWYDSLNAAPALARGLAALESYVGALAVSVWDGGQWRPSGLIQVAGPEVPKRQVVALDLRQAPQDSVRVRIEGTPSFWLLDHVGMDFSAPQPFQSRETALEHAVDNSGRDVSAQLRSVDGRYYVAERGDGVELSFRVPPLPAGMARTWILDSTGWYRLHSNETGAPRIALLERVMRNPLDGSRIAVARAGEILAAK